MDPTPVQQRRPLFRHPIWSVGFRPFFLLAFGAGALLPLVWALAFAGAIRLPARGLPPLAWHAHEMFYGFGWAVMAGFLLTATRAWLQIRGMHGGPLAFAVLLWLVERAAVFLPPSPLRTVLLNLFLPWVVGWLVVSLLRHRQRDIFPDNGYFVLALPLFPVAKNLLVSPMGWTVGIGMTLGLYRLAFAVMFERTTSQFMRNAMGVELPRRRWLDHGIKGLLAIGIFQALLPAPIVASVLMGAALLLLGRFATWSPRLGLRRFDIGVMYVGQLGLALHLALESLRLAGVWTGFGTLSLHAFTFLCMGLIVPAMLVRICQGHTGRKPQFARSDRIAIWLMGLAAFLRLVATQIWHDGYALLVGLAALCWSACFVVIGLRLGPFLLQPRADGREV